MRIPQAVIAVSLVWATHAVAQNACARPSDGPGPKFYIEQVTGKPRDSLVVARLCLAPGKNGVGSYMATLTYDTTSMRVATVRSSGGMQVANSRIAGLIRLAGAAPSGFSAGELASMSFVPSRLGKLSAITLSVGEASTPAGVSVARETKAFGWQVQSTAIPRPRVDSISPRSAEVSHERVTDLILYGRGFMPTGNTVVFGTVEVSDLSSEKGGTVIRFAAPTEFPARGAAPARRIAAGRVDVRVRHSGGASNAVVFAVEDDR
jgi:hypothetical protein